MLLGMTWEKNDWKCYWGPHEGANCVEGSCFSLYFMLTVYEVDGEGKTGGKYYWLALVLKYKLAYSNFPCL